MKIIWSDLGLLTLEKNLQYLEENWPIEVVRKFISAVEQVIQLIQKNPDVFRLWDKKGSVRIARINDHTSLLYEYDSNAIHILLIWNHKRDPLSLKKLLKH